MLVSMKEILKKAEEKGYAIGCINTPNIGTLRVAVDTAEGLNVPIIIDHARTHDPLIPMGSIGPKMVKYAKQTRMSVCVCLDHGGDYSSAIRTIRCGFPSIIYDLSALLFEENAVGLKEFTKIAHDLNIVVEAELGIMTSMREDSHGGSIGWTRESIKKTFIGPQQATEFAGKAGVDVLAVCFGVVRDIYAKPPLLGTEKVKTVRAVMSKETRVAMYGGSGVDGEQVRATTIAGCSRINYYSYVVTATSRHVQEYLNERDGKAFWHEVEEESYRFMEEYTKRVPAVFKNGKWHRG